VILGITPTWAVILRYTPEEMFAANEILSCANPAYFRAIKNKHFGVGKYKYILEGKKFPAGLVPHLIKEATKQGITVQVGIDQRPKLQWEPPAHDMFGELSSLGETLYPQQVEGALRCLESPDNGYIKAGTGAGKTEMMFAIYESYRRKQPIRALLLVTSEDLHTQAIERIQSRFGVHQPIYQIRGEMADLPDHGLVVSTYQTLHNRLFGGQKSVPVRDVNGKMTKRRETRLIPASPAVQAWVKGVQVAFIDECDLMPAGEGKGKYQACVRALENVAKKVGFSATPISKKSAWRNLQLRGWLGGQFYHYKDEARLEQGRVALSYIYSRMVGDEEEFLDLNYGEEALDQALYEYEPYVQAILGENDNEGCRWLYRNDLPTMVLVDRRRFGEKVLSVLQRHFPPHEVAYIDGDVTKKFFKATRDAFEAGQVKIVVATQKIGRGQDWPITSGLVLARMLRDENALEQAAGRGDRDKRRFGRRNFQIVIDIINMRFIDAMKQGLARIEKYKKKKTYRYMGDAPLEIPPDDDASLP
jgi:superfamily II DNA or RNA helicase